ncbi:hypothetical protein MERGE_001653 [Pneumocystis wakefieldiae]|uniref:methylated diphthine methylhydrolase n=1 Tax=Pneumocystis wakefieldiae TaxID=38082 RepID=A0A899FUL7_9ASCO|nr:hypothetical protein MERGE_001653 [Pneumocystis wakefieldiae]
MKAGSKYTGYSPFPIDVVLFSPVYLNLFVAGSYFLEINHQRRGHLLLYEVGHSGQTVKLLQNIESAAVLDMKWIPDSMKRVLVADSAGGLSVYELLGPSNPSLRLVAYRQVFDQDTLILSVSVSNIGKSAIVSTSMGDLCVFDLNSLQIQQKWKAHGLECWTSCYNTDSSAIFSGSDDCTFKVWDIRSSIQPLFTNTKSHQAGVISFVSFEKNLITGSFDDHIRLFDSRDFSRNIWTENMNSPWRLVQNPENQFRILGCLMYDGAKLFDLDISKNDAHNVEIYKEFAEHESIVYAGDWYSEQEVVTCSFYDKKICLW